MRNLIAIVTRHIFYQGALAQILKMIVSHLFSNFMQNREISTPDSAFLCSHQHIDQARRFFKWDIDLSCHLLGNEGKRLHFTDFYNVNNRIIDYVFLRRKRILLILWIREIETSKELWC